MKIFLTGASGYIGGTVALKLQKEGHSIQGLVRTPERGEEVRAVGIEPIIGILDDSELLARCAASADATINTADADHEGAAEALTGALKGSGKTLIHTSGSSIVGTPAEGVFMEKIYDETTQFTPTPHRAARVAIDHKILAAADGGDFRAIIICPSLIYGPGCGVGKHSIQVPWLLNTAKKFGAAMHIGPGTNRWSNVHIDDLANLYSLALAKAPNGSFYYAENGENSMKEVCEAISRMLGFGGGTETMTIEQAAEEWGGGPARNTMASNSRVRALRARSELGWAPKARSLIDDIENGSYSAAPV